MTACQGMAYACMCLALHARCGPAAAVLPLALLRCTAATDVVAGTLVMLLFFGCQQQHDDEARHNNNNNNGTQPPSFDDAAAAGDQLRWGACAAWAMLGATHIVLITDALAVAHAAVGLLALAIITTDGSSFHLDYLPFVERAAVYLALSVVDPPHGGADAMLRYGAALFACSGPMLAAVTAVLVAAVAARVQLRNPYYYHRLLRSVKKGQRGCGEAQLLALLSHCGGGGRSDLNCGDDDESADQQQQASAAAADAVA